MKSENAQPLTAIVVSLVLGFAIGFASKGWLEKGAAMKAATVPVHKMNDASNNWLASNQLVAPDIWRIYLDPLWTPVSSPIPPLTPPALVRFPVNVPKVQTIESDHDIQVIVQVPGLTERDVDVQVGKTAVAIRGQKTEDKRDDGKGFQTVQESFEETMRLPCKVLANKAKATVKNGVLTVSIPRADKTIAHGKWGNWQ